MIKVKIICDSINQYGVRITTWELIYPRIVHSELMTHRMLSKNSASSRAIPIASMIQTIRDTPAEPEAWGKNQPGMQAKEELQGDALDRVKYLWNRAKEFACDISQQMADEGAHKQIANRVTEPYQHMKVVLTGTDFNNLWWLRDHPDADPTIWALVKEMHYRYENNKPDILQPGMWHLPYVLWEYAGETDNLCQIFYDENDREITLEQAQMISVSCCAQLSYRKSDGSLEKAENIFKKLIESKPCHASPTEHQAVCIDTQNLGKVAWQDLPEGITHITRDLQFYSGNLRDWIQFRQLIPDNVRKY